MNILNGTIVLAALINSIVTLVLVHMFTRAIWGMVTKKYAPFVPVPDQALTLLEDIKEIAEAKTIYDLGCGDGKVLLTIAKRVPRARCIGIEYNILPYVLAKIKTRKNKNISIKYKNFFKEDLSQADVIVVYLFPELLDALLPKFEKELRQGAVVYSFDFVFAKKEPESIKYNTDKTATRGKRLLPYRF